MSIPRKNLDTSNGRKKTNKLSWCSFFKSLNPCIFARCDSAFYFSNEYTMVPLLRHPRPKAVISPAIHFCTPSLLLKFPLPSTQMWPIVSSQGTEIGETGSFSHRLRACFQWQLCCVPWRRPSAHLAMRVSLPVEISKLDLLLDYILHLLIFQLRSCWCQDLLLGLGDGFTGSPGPSGDI